MLKKATTNYYGDIDISSRFLVRVCTESLKEEDQSSSGESKAKNTLKGAEPVEKSNYILILRFS